MSSSSQSDCLHGSFFFFAVIFWDLFAFYLFIQIFYHHTISDCHLVLSERVSTRLMHVLLQSPAPVSFGALCVYELIFTLFLHIIFRLFDRFRRTFL